MTWDEKWILYNNQGQQARWLDQEPPKHFPKPNLHQKNGHGHCLVVCYPSDLLQVSESLWNHYIWEVWSANRKLQGLQPALSIERARFFSRTMPYCRSHTQCFKSWTNWAAKLYLFHHIRWFLANWLLLLQASFCRRNASQPAGGKNAFQEFIESWNMDFYATGINKSISCSQKCVDCMVPILINKDVFEPSYNDLKFKVQNCNYFFINLIFAQN